MKNEADTKEADIVSARITRLLSEESFQISPTEWIAIQKRLFNGVFDHAGKLREHNITKKEGVLGGATVVYASYYSFKETLAYDFELEKEFAYDGLSKEEVVKPLAKFASDIWQIHPFCEGITRAIAVFMVKYMKPLEFETNNKAFESNSWYFRNDLICANYNDFYSSVHDTMKCLEMFLAT